MPTWRGRACPIRRARGRQLARVGGGRVGGAGAGAPEHVVLGDRRARNHDGRGVLDLHLAQQYVAVLGELDVCVGGSALVAGGGAGARRARAGEAWQASQRMRRGRQRQSERSGWRSPPAPPTSILIVPFGPKLVFMTSYSPFAALMFMKRAAFLPITSAPGFKVFTEPMAP